MAKMSKSLKNVVNPDDVIAEYGADTFRLYEMYMGPLEASKPWNTRDISGLHPLPAARVPPADRRGHGRARCAPSADAEIEKLLHRTTAKVQDDIERLAFNTAIAALIKLVNEAGSAGLTRDQASRFVRLLAPFTPHVAEELWHKLGEHDVGRDRAVACVRRRAARRRHGADADRDQGQSAQPPDRAQGRAAPHARAARARRRPRARADRRQDGAQGDRRPGKHDQHRRGLKIEQVGTSEIFPPSCSARLLVDGARRLRCEHAANARAAPTPPEVVQATPPVAPRHPTQSTLHGDVRIDDYAWLRNKDTPEVLSYLHAENAYTEP